MTQIMQWMRQHRGLVLGLGVALLFNAAWTSRAGLFEAYDSARATALALDAVHAMEQAPTGH